MSGLDCKAVSTTVRARMQERRLTPVFQIIGTSREDDPLAAARFILYGTYVR